MKKFLAAAVAAACTLSLLVVPAGAVGEAAAGEVVATFGEWILQAAEQETAKQAWNAIYEDGRTYDDFSQDVADTYGTTFTQGGSFSEGSGGSRSGQRFVYYFEPTSNSVASINKWDGKAPRIAGGYSFSGNWSWTGSVPVQYAFYRAFYNESKVTIPYESDWEVFVNIQAAPETDYRSHTTIGGHGTATAGYEVSTPANAYLECRWDNPAKGATHAASMQAYVVAYPHEQPAEDAPDVSEDTQPANITNNEYFWNVEDGGVVTDSYTVVNTTNNTYTNPATGTETPYASYVYDYTNRGYQFFAEDGSSVGKVVYGDEHMTVTTNEGDTYTYNYYMSEGGSGTGGGGSTDEEPEKETIWDKLGNLVGTAVNGIIGAIEAVIGKVLDAVTSLLQMINERLQTIVQLLLGWMDSLPQLFGGFLELLGSLFSFLPEECVTLLEFGLAAVIFVAIIRMIRG